MADIKIYTTRNCPYCVAAMSFLDSKGLAFKEIDLTNDPDQMEKLKERTGWLTVPQIFIDDELIGGYTDLRKLESTGELEKKLL
ncbi:MAG: glutaredoxin 3 [Bacillota bacterium]